MAEKALQKVEEDLSCLVCLDTYTSPKLLQCHHVFCRGCLEGLVKQDQLRQLTLICPECRQVTPVPAGGVAGLQAAFHINHLLDILKEHKKATGDARYCPKHPTRELESFCETCDKIICLECAVTHHQHHNHKLISQLFQQSRKAIVACSNRIKDQLTATRKAVDDLKVCNQEIIDKKDCIEAKICEDTRKIHEAVEARKVELIEKLNLITDEKLKGNASQTAQMESTVAQMGRYLDTVSKCLQTNCQGEVVKMKTTLERQANKFSRSFNQDSLKPSIEADMLYKSPSNGAAPDVFTQGSPDPAHCYIASEDLEEVTVGEKHTIILHVIDYQNKPCKKPVTSIDCELVSELTSSTVKGTAERKGETQYKISFQPTVKGRHQLHIQTEGQHIKESPFNVIVKLPLKLLGDPILTFQSEKPHAIAINQQQQMIVAQKRQISVCTPTGERIHSIDIRSELGNLFGVTTGNVENIIAAGIKGCYIQWFTVAGKRIKSVKDRDSNYVGVTFNHANNKIYAVDAANDCIEVLRFDLTSAFIFGEFGRRKGDFDGPWGIACDSTGRLYVTEQGNLRIQVFTAEGEFIKVLWRADEELGEPCGIAVDASDMIYFSQPYKHLVTVLTYYGGRKVTSFSTRLQDELHMCGPLGLAVDKYGLVYVCDKEACKVKIF